MSFNHLINPVYSSSASKAQENLNQKDKNRNEKFYAFYPESLVTCHKELYPQVNKAQDISLWPEFSLKKIKLFEGETLTDLLLANAIVLAQEFIKLSPNTDLKTKVFSYYNELASKRISLASPFFNNLRRTGERNLSSCFIMEVGDSLESIMKHLTYCARISKAGGGCVQAHTEYLTPNGWKRISEYSEGDLVGQYRHETKTIEFVKPEAYIKAPCAEFYHLKSKYGIDQELSEEHRVLYKSESHSKKLKSISAKDLVEKHNNNARGFKGKFLFSAQGVSSKGLDYSTEQLQLIVAMQADGHIQNKNTGYSIFTFKKPRKIARIKQILNKLNRPFTETAYCDGETRIAFYYPELIKDFPQEFYSLNSAQLALIAEEVKYWDGCPVKGDSSWSGTVRSNADFVQFAMSVSGYKASIKTDNRKDRQKCYRVHGTYRNEGQLAKDSRTNNAQEIRTVASVDGFKYCFTVETGALILRNNDSVFITGNSGVYMGLLRGKGASIGSNKNASSSVMAWIRLFDQVCVSVNQLGQRPGAITVALPIWHIDIEEFLDCQTENGDLRAKAYNIQPQVCVDNEFMHAVIDNQSYALYCPKDLWDANINPSKDTNWHVRAEKLGLIKKEINARKLWAVIQERQLTVGRPYIFFTNNAQINSPFKNYGNINSANLCCESFSYFEVDSYIHCCNLISINLAEHDSLKSIEDSTKIATEMADLSLNLSSINILEAQKHIKDFRTIGIGMMGLADWLAKNESYYSDLNLIESTQKAISLAAYRRSVELAKEWGSCLAPNLESALWNKLDLEPESGPWKTIRAEYGIRNAMFLATAPNTSTSLVMGATASFLPPYSLDFIDESEDYSLQVITKYKPELYLTNQEINQQFITDCTAVMQKWTDAGISMEYLLPKGASWSTNKAFSDNKIEAWKQGVKAVYYVRSTTPDGSSGTSGCSSCAN